MRTLASSPRRSCGADLARLAEQVKLVEEHAEVIHIDIMDGHFVPPLALGAVVVKSLRPVTDRALHGHLMVDAPESFFDELAEAGMDMVSFHVEAVGDPGPAIAKARGADLDVGLAAQSRDAGRGRLPVPGGDRRRDADEHPAGLVGTDLQRRGLPRLEAVRSEIERQGPRRRSGDRRGRQGRRTPRGAVDAGANVLVAASGVFGQPDIAAAARRLAPDREGSRLVPETILVVDDDPDIARFVEVNLRSAGYDVSVAGDGEEALTKAGRAAPRPRPARRDDAAHRRVRGRAAAAEESADREHQHHHAHGEGAVHRQGARA